jgi:type I restriction enzyme S subunit
MELKPGYKRTEVGVIPEEWEVSPIEAFATVSSGGTPSREISAYWHGSIPWITTSQIDFGAIDKADQYITEDGLNNSAAKLLPAGTLLMALYGQGKTRGKVGVLSFEAATNQACAAISIQGSVTRDFLLYFLTSQYEVIRNSSNAGSQENLSGEIVRRIKVPLPPLSEQRAIAAALSDVDALLAKLDQLIAKERDLKQAAMQQLLTGKRRLPGFSGKWEVRPFEAVLTRLNGKAYQVQTSDYRQTGLFPVVDQGKTPIIGYTDRVDKLFRCPAEGVIVFGDHTCIVKFIDFDFVVGADGTQILAANSGQRTRFHAYQLEYDGITTTGYNRHFKFLKEHSYFSPCRAEQTAIATVLSDMDAEIAELEARREKTRALKQGMMQELLTGRIRLM